ncbi:MAG: hypothetical protein P5702_06925 [Limnospira sp. PMC 1291.21]|uniref:Uncharacterized protein n=4 Tax=Sirenicapillariaceae TaxID=2934961 RepID=A0A9P1KJT6_9CYAN|nr:MULTISPECIES: hypothetical protein [Limnospira]MDC0840045.1 hypothetical protein [Limnoraphis robusta]MDT9218084.1 hypothetical protein [Limnospira sp. PMC 1240.20]MDT9223261.1 hypothetical protein [Limnospira sp. PMC 1279.21]MDT9228225.1 hypothetical protein [Limnospira sp. PMC 1242.20]MDT9233250.1 hypothetical protein [Limnospira sp. PMC 917.15]MDY7052871.1 hypothetical protein [Limnospira fusiformis LS22]QJB25146.1 hypothetical protein HFV01_04230 [Limnospira fusiformis SAG 85.79]UWU4
MNPKYGQIKQLAMKLYCFMLSHPETIPLKSESVRRHIAALCFDAAADFLAVQDQWIEEQESSEKSGN